MGGAERGAGSWGRSGTSREVCPEGANREKLTVKKIINKEMFFFSPFMSLTNREKSTPNREKIGTKP